MSKKSTLKITLPNSEVVVQQFDENDTLLIVKLFVSEKLNGDEGNSIKIFTHKKKNP
jgi:hypothetical protein